MTTDSTVVTTPHRVPRGLALVFVCVSLCSLSPVQAFSQNTPPVIQINAGLTLDEGSASTISSSLLLVIDAEQGPAAITYTVVSGPANGTLSPGTSFTQYDIENNLVTYTHDGGETTMDYFTFSVSDGAGGAISSTPFIITITPVNDPPVLAANGGLMVNEGFTSTINTTDLQVTDSDNTPAELTYTVVSIPMNGTLSRETSFTQYDIDNNFVTYTHDGGETTSDNFIFSVSDAAGGTIPSTVFSITITPENDSPVLAVNDGLTLNEGATAKIATTDLQVTDAEQEPAALTYTVVSSPTNGTLSPGASFTQYDIDNNFVTYTHDGGETTSDDFIFSVSDGAGGTISSTVFSITITPENDSPVLAVNDGLTLNEGATATITTTDLQVTDAEQEPAALTYTVVSIPMNGTLSPGASFTQYDIDNNFVTYTHDGGETTSDDFIFSVSDGAGGTISSTVFSITITPENDSPVLAVNDGLTLNEGATATITTTDLQVTDAEQEPAALTYTVVSIPMNGTLSPGASFTQYDIDNNFVTYTHDGGETTSDDFIFSVSDGAGGTISSTMFSITITPVNDAPVIGANNGLSIMRGGSETITRGQLFANDPDDTPVDVLFTVTTQPSVGTLVLSGSPGPSTFTQDDIDYGRLEYEHDGSNSTQDMFSFELSDTAATTGPYNFVITVLGTSEEPPVITLIVDVGNDQGRSVLITFQKCGADTTGSPTPVLEYGAFRRIDPLPSVSSNEGNEAPALDGWVFVGSIPANGESVYNMVAPTLADSTAEGGIHWSVFFIRALTAAPTTYFDSAPDSGYSVDNLAPGVPLNLAYEAPGILTWDDVPEPDFDFYTVYGSSSDIFDETAEILGHATESTLDVQAQPHTYFFVTATDFNGNEGGAAGIANPTGIAEPALVLKASISAHPNPFNPATTIVYTVEDAGPVTVAVYDVIGNLVATLVDNEHREPDEYRIEYRPRGASGVYFVRLETGRKVRNAKLVLMK